LTMDETQQHTRQHERSRAMKVQQLKVCNVNTDASFFPTCICLNTTSVCSK